MEVAHVGRVLVVTIVVVLVVVVLIRIVVVLVVVVVFVVVLVLVHGPRPPRHCGKISDGSRLRGVRRGGDGDGGRGSRGGDSCVLGAAFRSARTGAKMGDGITRTPTHRRARIVVQESVMGERGGRQAVRQAR